MRDARKRAGEAEIAPDEEAAPRPDDAPGEDPVDRPAARQKEPKVKVTYSLPVSLARLINAVSSELGVDACDLVEELMSAALKGCRRPTVPGELKRSIGQRKKSAA